LLVELVLKLVPEPEPELMPVPVLELELELELVPEQVPVLVPEPELVPARHRQPSSRPTTIPAGLSIFSFSSKNSFT